MLALLTETQEHLLQVGGAVTAALLADAWFTHTKAGGFVPSGQPLDGWWERRGWLVLCVAGCLAALVPTLVAHIFRLEETVERWRPYVFGLLTFDLVLTRDLGRIGLDLFGAEIVLLAVAARRPTWRMRVACVSVLAALALLAVQAGWYMYATRMWMQRW